MYVGIRCSSNEAPRDWSARIARLRMVSNEHTGRESLINRENGWSSECRVRTKWKALVMSKVVHSLQPDCCVGDSADEDAEDTGIGELRGTGCGLGFHMARYDSTNSPL